MSATSGLRPLPQTIEPKGSDNLDGQVSGWLIHRDQAIPAVQLVGHAIGTTLAVTVHPVRCG